MAQQKTIDRWLEETGIDPAQVKFDGDNPVVWFDCGRCGGTGYIYAFGHVEGGLCFECHGAKGRYRGLQGLASRARNRHKVEARRQAKLEETRAKGSAFLAENPALAEALQYSARNLTLGDLLQKVYRFGSLSTKQISLALKIAAEVVAAEQRKAAEEIPPEGRQEIEGEVVSVKWKESQWGGSLKLLVDCGTYRLYGTCPSSLDEVERGDRVHFTATVDPQEAGFGFFKRPTKASQVEA